MHTDEILQVFECSDEARGSAIHVPDGGGSEQPVALVLPRQAAQHLLDAHVVADEIVLAGEHQYAQVAIEDADELLGDAFAILVRQRVEGRVRALLELVRRAHRMNRLLHVHSVEVTLQILVAGWEGTGLAHVLARIVHKHAVGAAQGRGVDDLVQQ